MPTNNNRRTARGIKRRPKTGVKKTVVRRTVVYKPRGTANRKPRGRRAPLAPRFRKAKALQKLRSNRKPINNMLSNITGHPLGRPYMTAHANHALIHHMTASATSTTGVGGQWWYDPLMGLDEMVHSIATTSNQWRARNIVITAKILAPATTTARVAIVWTTDPTEQLANLREEHILVRDNSLKCIIDISSNNNQSINKGKLIMKRAATPFMYTNNKDGIALAGDEADITLDKIYPLRFAMYLLSKPSGGNVEIMLYHDCIWEFYGKGLSKPIVQPGGIPFIGYPIKEVNCNVVKLFSVKEPKAIKHYHILSDELRQCIADTNSDLIANEFWTTKPVATNQTTLRATEFPKTMFMNGVEFFHRVAPIYIGRTGPLYRIIIETEEDLSGEVISMIKPITTFLQYNRAVKVTKSINDLATRLFTGASSDHDSPVSTQEIDVFNRAHADIPDDENYVEPCTDDSDCDSEDDDDERHDYENERCSDRGQSDYYDSDDDDVEGAAVNGIEDDDDEYEEIANGEDEMRGICEMKKPTPRDLARFRELYFLQYGRVDVHSFHKYRQDIGVAMHYCHICTAEDECATVVPRSRTVRFDTGSLTDEFESLSIEPDEYYADPVIEPIENF